ncbi:MAG: M28 family peptidase [Polyangiales bacterium]
MRHSAACVALLLVGCTDPPAAVAPRDAAMDRGAVVDAPDTPDVAPPHDAPVAVDTPPADPARCATPDACAWIEDYQRDVVGRLSGERPITPGVTLTRRSSAAQRETARAWLRDELRRVIPDADYLPFATGQNVRATLPATQGGDLPRIIVGAHYDGVPAGPAAADDATGVALVLVAARYLAARPRRDHPVEFVLFDQEEVGLLGSAAYATALRSAGAAVDSAHCFDMLSFDGNGDHAVELWSPAAGLEDLYRRHGAPRGIPVRAVRFASSDHQSFLTRGFVATGVGEEFVGNDHTPHYHRVTDTYDRVDFGYLARMTRLALDVLEDRAVD